MDESARNLRARHWDLYRAADQVPQRSGGGTARRLVQVYDGGSMPTEPDHFFLSHPVELDGSETESGGYTPTADTDQTIPVDVLWHAPAVGDILTAYAVGGRWVAERGGPSGGGSLVCSPCNIPKQDLTLSWTNTLTGNGSTTLTYNAALSNWTTGCVLNQQYKLFCSGGQIDFSVIYIISGTCPTGQTNTCSNLTANPFGLTLVSHTCTPFSFTWTTVPDCPNVEAPGYIDFTITL